MDTARYVFAVLIVSWLPPAMAWWVAVHPFVHFWRRIGPKGSLWILGTLGVAGVVCLTLVRDRLVGTDLGTRPELVGLAIVFGGISTWIAIVRRRHLTTRILSGVPELEPGGGGTLLTEGIYARIRHPRYVEIWVGTLAYACFANHVGSWIVWLATGPGLHLIVLLEERELRARFGADYEAYESRVPRYVPRAWRIGPRRGATTDPGSHEA